MRHAAHFCNQHNAASLDAFLFNSFTNPSEGIDHGVQPESASSFESYAAHS